MRLSSLPVVAAAAGMAALAALGAASAQEQGLRRPSAFDDIKDADARSRALFTEAAKVITHPRCLNCHPATDRPLQGDDSRPHFPYAPRGEGGVGTATALCSTCHQDRNVDLAAAAPDAKVKSIPGHPRWHLAPLEMAWEGRSNGEICAQLKDPHRNGGKSLAALHEHFAKDDLVAWGWTPGAGRPPAPGTQALVGQLIEAWVASGAHCP
jgi:hypothetical protein